jgi:hypothetical protein
MPFQRTPFADVVAAVIERLQSFDITATWVGLQERPQMWLGDYQISLAPGAASLDEGTATGTGYCGSLIRRTVALTLQSRSYEDEGERATQALYEHLALEEQILAALHLWMPAGGIVTEPLRLAPGAPSQPQQANGVIGSVLTFETLYGALLQ